MSQTPVPGAPTGKAGPDGPASPRRALACCTCGATTTAMVVSSCPACQGTMRVAVDRTLAGPWLHREQGLWRYAPALLPLPKAARVSLAEGGTPLIATERLAHEIGVGRLWLKDETRNPTGTFKDRCIAVAASVAVDAGAPGLVCASTGNAGASTAAYAARAGLPAIILVPEAAAASKMAQAIAFGARLVQVRGTYSDAYALARAAADELGYVNTTTTFVSPYSVEGSRTVAHELVEQCEVLPDWIVVPIGAGPLLVGIQETFRDLLAEGLVDRIPRMLAVQPAGCAPIVQAFIDGAEHVAAWGEPETVVGSLADPLWGYADEGDLTLAAMRASDGGGVAAADEETLAAVRELAAMTGVFGEPGGAIALAGARIATGQGLIGADESVVLCITGTGLKDPHAALLDPEQVVVSKHPEELLRWLGSTYNFEGGRHGAG